MLKKVQTFSIAITTILPFIFIFTFIFGIIPSQLIAIELKTAAQESAPKYCIKGNDNDNKKVMSGLCIDILNAVDNEIPEISFIGHDKFLPFKRLQKYLGEGELDIFFGLKKTPSREKLYNFIDIPLYQINYVIAVRTDEDIPIIETIEDIKGLSKAEKILTVSGTGANKFLQNQKGLIIDDGANTPKLLLKKLLAKRGQFAFYHDIGLHTAIKNGKLEKKVRILPASFLKYSHYVAFSKKVPEDIVNTIKHALEKLQSSGELISIYKKYSCSK